MRLQHRFRLVAALALLAGLLGFGLADWAGSTSGYTVQAGDSLWAIAQAHGVTVAQLASANSLDPNAILPIGIHLVIPGAAYQPGSPPAATRNLGPWSFCSRFVPDSGPVGVLPPGLAAHTYRQLQPIFEHWSSYYDLSLPLLEAVAWQESGWQQSAVSSTGAVGIGQIEPGTAVFISQFLVGGSLNVERSVSDNIRASAAFLTYLAGVEGNNRCATIAAYYEGPTNLQLLGVLPDTAQYVADVEALVARFE